MARTSQLYSTFLLGMVLAAVCQTGCGRNPHQESAANDGGPLRALPGIVEMGLFLALTMLLYTGAALLLCAARCIRFRPAAFPSAYRSTSFQIEFSSLLAVSGGSIKISSTCALLNGCWYKPKTGRYKAALRCLRGWVSENTNAATALVSHMIIVIMTYMTITIKKK